MALDNAEFVDSSLGSVRSQGFNTIRLKALSHLRVTSAYKKYLEELKVEKSKLAGTVAFAGPDGNILESEKKNILAKTTVIAKLEEQIKIMDREAIPHDFVKRRAIKLLDSWLANCRYNGQSAYSVGVENQDKLFAEELTSESADSLEENAVTHTTDKSSITPETVGEIINDQLDAVDESSKIAPIEKFDDVDEIPDFGPANSSDLELPEYDFTSEEPQETSAEEFDSGDIRALINDQLNAVGLEQMRVSSPQSPARIEEFRDDSLGLESQVSEVPLRAEPVIAEPRIPELVEKDYLVDTDFNDYKNDSSNENEYMNVTNSEDNSYVSDDDPKSLKEELQRLRAEVKENVARVQEARRRAKEAREKALATVDALRKESSENARMAAVAEEEAEAYEALASGFEASGVTKK